MIVCAFFCGLVVHELHSTPRCSLGSSSATTATYFAPFPSIAYLHTSHTHLRARVKLTEQPRAWHKGCPASGEMQLHLAAGMYHSRNMLQRYAPRNFGMAVVPGQAAVRSNN